jgi:hypothetical protein
VPDFPFPGGAGELVEVQSFEGGKEVVVDESEEVVAGGGVFAEGVGVGPGGPAQMGGDRRPVGGVEQPGLGFEVAVDLVEEHPAQLGDPLSVAVDPGVFPHDVLDGLDRGR